MSIKTRDKGNNDKSVANGQFDDNENSASMMPPAQLFASSTKEDKDVSQLSKASSGKGTALPEEVQGKMENSMGHDFSNVDIHENSDKATNLGAKAYAQGNEVHFAPGQYNPESEKGQQLIGHELAHVVQQREGKVEPTKKMGKGMSVNDDPALESQADKMGAKATKGVAGTGGDISGNTDVGSPVVQGFFEEDRAGETWSQADDLSLAVKQGYPNHELYAKKGKVAESNRKLKAVGSGVELIETGTKDTFKKTGSGYTSYDWFAESEELSKVEVRNKENATEGDNMELWADCGKSNGVVVGGSDREAIYNNPAGIESGVDGGPAIMKTKIMKEWLTDKLTTASAPEQAAIKAVMADAKGYENMLPSIVTEFHAAKTEEEKDDVRSKYGAYTDKIAEVYWEYYNGLDKSERDIIDEQIGINNFANPEVGQGYTTSSGGDPVPGTKTWNFHWGGVVMESDDKSDKIVLENYAVGDASVENKKWDFAMYGTKKKGQTFHEVHKDTNQHGKSPTTMKIEKK